MGLNFVRRNGPAQVAFQTCLAANFGISSSVSKKWNRPRPSRFALYMAISAAFNSSS